MYQNEKNEMNEIKSNLYSIGEISEMTGLSVSAIRYYSEKGLIVPSYIDESTGYRYFSARHVWKLEIIKMYKQLGFSLKDIMELQETRSLDVLEWVIDKSEKSVRKQLEDCHKTLKNLNWLRDQCGIFRQARAETDFTIRNLPKRRVVYMAAKADVDIWDFAVPYQKKVTRELQMQETIQRCYGFILKNDSLQRGELKIEGEYINLGSYHSHREEELKVLPEGDYLCIRTIINDWSQEEWVRKLQEILDRIKKLEINPDIMLLEEVSLYLLSLEDTIYELQIRMPE